MNVLFSFHEQSYINCCGFMGVAQGPESPNLCSDQSKEAEINCYCNNCLIATFLSFVLVAARRQLLEIKEVARFKDRFRTFSLGRS